MIPCAVCGTQNEDFSIVCVSCKSFIQAKVETLDLFRTMWGLGISPRSTFKKIILAKHKNYLLLLSSTFGVAVVFMALWSGNHGNHVSNVFTLIATGIVLGPPVGMLLNLVLGLILHRIGSASSVRNCRAVVSYSSAPFIVSLIILLPVELAVFGVYFFGDNPPPYALDAPSYFALLGLNGFAAGLSWILLMIGTSVLKGVPTFRGFLFSLPLVLVVTAGLVIVS